MPRDIFSPSSFWNATIPANVAFSTEHMTVGTAKDGTYLGGGVPVPDDFTPRQDNDASAVFYQPDYIAPDGRRGRLYELWGMVASPDYDPSKPLSPSNTRWMARWGGRMVGVTGEGVGYWRDCWWSGCGHQADTNADPDAWGRPDSQAQQRSWGVTAASLPLLGTQVALDECRSGVIGHAIGLEVPAARREHWWPAQRTDGLSYTTTLTQGMRLTFPPGAVKPSGLTALGAALWDAAKRHGLVIDDTSGENLTIRVEPGCETTPLWGGVDAFAQLDNFPWGELRVIEPGSASNPNPTS